jgi:hypothetical protein
VLFVTLLLQIAQVDARPDSVYATPALRAFVQQAAVGNLVPPPALAGYRATVESEMAFILRDSLGRELVGQVEQLAAHAEWERSGRYDLHVLGYRSQSAGGPYSALTFTRMYSVPTLYGNRLAMGMNDGLPRTRGDSIARVKRLARDSAAGRSPYRVIHPLATDRDRFYRFSGGDTAAILYTNGRAIRIVRVQVDPVRSADQNYTGFRGHLDFDADRHQLVRMRGRLETLSRQKLPVLLRAMEAVAIAYVEFENAEINGKYWLPAVQRSEFQAQMGMMGDTRPIYRIVSRFRDYEIADTAVAVAGIDSIVPLPSTRATLTFAKGDSASRYGGWEVNLGTLTGAVGSDDFADLAPDVWKASGRPRYERWPRTLDDVVRYNRVEGLFTGVGGAIHFRDAAPGLVLRTNAGWAWVEHTMRGGVSLALTRGKWTQSLRADRALATTNDYLLAFERGSSIGTLISGVDDYDYVDRWTAAASVSRIIKDIDRAIVTTELAVVGDRYPRARLASGAFHGGKLFRPNRRALEGDYTRATAMLEFHPRVSGETLTSGFGARLKYEITVGDFAWQRMDARLAARAYWHGLLFSSRVDAGMISGRNIAPQAIYEMGGGMELPSYEYKEFGGDRAALGRGLVAYYFPVLRTPRRVFGLVFPGLSPGFGAGVQGGWAEQKSASGAFAIAQLNGGFTPPLSRPTDGIRATADVRLTLLSGAIGFGFARPMDHFGPWKPFFIWGAAF